MSQRTYPTAEHVAEIMRERFKHWLRLCGFDADVSEVAAVRFSTIVQSEITQWFATLPAMLIRNSLVQHGNRIDNHGLVLVRIDRNPGRVMAMCVEAWKQLNAAVFTASPRYLHTNSPLACNDENYIEDTMMSMRKTLAKAGSSMKFSRAAHATRPRAYWTVKQKSTLTGPVFIVKVRPIVAHFRHPCRQLLRRIGRALSLIVQAASKLVQSKRPNHAPMWQLHSGSREWIARLVNQLDTAAVAEFDAEDCFVNTPRDEVLQAVKFWLEALPRRTRGKLYFSISKDNKAADRMGRSFSADYWEIPAALLVAVVCWELTMNADFEAVSDGRPVVFKQHRGLPIGGHLSAALCKLVALKREYISWTAELAAHATSRYRDNFFVAFASMPTPDECCKYTQALTGLLGMPVKFVSCGAEFRCLELRVSVCPGTAPKVVVAFRTDQDRQGESNDVTSWPPRSDPRARLVTSSLLQGLAAKLRLYRAEGTGGYTAAIRAALAFVRKRGYPSRWWVRPFAQALVRHGVPPGCLPRLLRKAIA